MNPIAIFGANRFSGYTTVLTAVMLSCLCIVLSGGAYGVDVGHWPAVQPKDAGKAEDSDKGPRQQEARVKLLEDTRAQAKALKDNDKAAEAVPLYLSAVRLGEQIYGPTDERLVPDLEELAWCHRQSVGGFETGEIYENRQFLISSYNSMKDEVDAGQKARDLEFIADSYLDEGILDCATKVYEQCVDLSESTDLKHAPDVLTQMSKLTWVRRKQYDHEKADSAESRLVQKVEQTFEKRPEASAKIIAQAKKHRESQLYDLSQKCYESALKKDISTLGLESPWVGVDCLLIAEQAFVQDQMQKAKNMVKRSQAVLRVAGHSKPNVMGENVIPYMELARSYEAAGDKRLAERTWQQCVELAAGGNLLESCMESQAKFYSSIGKHAKAESLLQELLAVYNAKEKKSPAIPSVMHELAKEYEYSKKLKKAEEIYKQLIEEGEKKKDSSWPIISMGDYAVLLKRMGRMSEAADLEARRTKLLNRNKN